MELLAVKKMHFASVACIIGGWRARSQGAEPPSLLKFCKTNFEKKYQVFTSSTKAFFFIVVRNLICNKLTMCSCFARYSIIIDKTVLENYDCQTSSASDVKSRNAFFFVLLSKNKNNQSILVKFQLIINGKTRNYLCAFFLV